MQFPKGYLVEEYPPPIEQRPEIGVADLEDERPDSIIRVSSWNGWDAR
jgi:hypothetical protein